MRHFLSLAGFVLLGMLAGCPATLTPATPAESAVDTTVIACRALTASIKSTDAMIKSNTLKGANADKAIDALTKAKAGCDVAVTSLQAAATAASGVAK